MVYKGVRPSLNPSTCTDPSTGPAPSDWDTAACGPWATPNAGAPGWELVPPTALDATTAPCSAQWLDVSCFFVFWEREEGRKIGQRKKKEEEKNSPLSFR